MTFIGKCHLEILRGLAEAYAGRFPTAVEKGPSEKVIRLTAQGLEACLKGQVKGVRKNRLKLLAVLYDRPFRSTKELCAAEGMSLFRWLYDLGEDTPYTGQAPHWSKRQALLSLLDIDYQPTAAEADELRQDELALYGEPA